MMIMSAYIELVERRGPIKAEMYLGSDDTVDNCEITGGGICIEEGSDILFKDCFIKDCEYSIKETWKPVTPCPIVIRCNVTDCKLPLGDYVDCVFENDGKREWSIAVEI